MPDQPQQQISDAAIREMCTENGTLRLLLFDARATIARQAAHIAEMEAPALLHRERGADPPAAGAPASLRPKPPRGPRTAAADEEIDPVTSLAAAGGEGRG